MKRRYLFLSLLLSLLCSCESDQALEDRMDRIEGDYLLSLYYEPVRGMLSEKYPRELASIVVARIIPCDGKWYFDYTLPVYSGGSFTFHHIQQRIIWDRQLGRYYFYELRDTDLPEGWELDDIGMDFDNRTITLYGNQTRYEWRKMN